MVEEHIYDFWTLCKHSCMKSRVVVPSRCFDIGVNVLAIVPVSFMLYLRAC